MTGRQYDGATAGHNQTTGSSRYPLTPSPRIFHLNALFDLELGGYPVESVRNGALEMGSLFSFCGTPQDRLLLDVRVPDDYWDYLDSTRIPYAPLLSNHDLPADYSGMPWGWNRNSTDRFGALGIKGDHPDLQAVKTVNNRAFCAAFNLATKTGVPGSCFCNYLTDIQQAVHDLNNQFPLVAKPAFGGAGFGFILIPGPNESPVGLDKLVKQHGCTIEPWCERLHDLSSSCLIMSDGTMSDLRHYRCYASKRGAFYGVALGTKPDPVIESHRVELDNAATSAATALFKAGYYGPASFDSFVYRNKSGVDGNLAAIIEINARYIMSTIAHSLHASVGTDRPCYFRFLGRKTSPMPPTYDECRKLLGSDWYDPEERKGIVLLSPLRVLHEDLWVRPVRSAFFIVGLTMEEVQAMDNRVRGLL